VKAPEAHEVFVAGTFNGWNPRSHPLKRGRNGRWETSLDLPPGLHQYKFIIDGRWCCDDEGDKPYDGCPGHASNPFGTMNLTLLVDDPRAHVPALGPLE
jgi:hypothetical protein